MMTVTKLKNRVRAYLKASGESPSGFSFRVMGNRGWCRELFNGVRGRKPITPTQVTIIKICSATSLTQARKFRNDSKK